MLLISHMNKAVDNQIWKALSDATRRQLLDHLRRGAATTGDLCRLHPELTRFGVMKHLSILEEAGLLLVKREGRYRWNSLNVTPIREIYERWVKPFEGHWAGGAIRIKQNLEKLYQSNPGEGGSKMPEKAINMAKVELQVEIAAPRDQVWEALTTQVAQWWREDFYAIPDSTIFLEPHVGGRLYEEAENGQQGLWYMVTGVYPGDSIEFSGNLRPEFGGPATSLLKISLEDHETKTLLRLNDVVFGVLGESMQKNATEGWQLLMAGGLKPHIENKTINS